MLKEPIELLSGSKLKHMYLRNVITDVLAEETKKHSCKIAKNAVGDNLSENLASE